MDAPRIGFDAAAPKSRRTVGATLLEVAIGCLAIAVVLVAPLVRVEHLQLRSVSTGVMRPLAQRGDLLVTQQTSTRSLRVGQIVALSPPGGGATVMHRIVTLKRTGRLTTITTRADGSRVADPWGPIAVPSSTTYRLVRVVPKLGFIPIWAHHSAASGRNVLIVGTGLLFIAIAAAAILPPRGRRRRRGPSWSS